MNESMNKFLPPDFVAKMRKEVSPQEQRELSQLIINGIDLVTVTARHMNTSADCVMVFAAAIAYLKLTYVGMGALTEEEFDNRFKNSVDASLTFLKHHSQ